MSGIDTTLCHKTVPFGLSDIEFIIFEKNNGVDENLVVTFHLDIFCHLGVYSHLALMAAFE